MIEDPVAAAEAAIAADHAHGDLAVWITRLPDDRIRARAAALAEEGPKGRPLWGVPFAVKDNIDIAGLPTTAACPGFARTVRTTSPAVQRLLDAGAVLIGKTNLDQFATGLVGVRSPYGTPRNVFDARYVPGGSSSGSGAVVAAGIVPVAIGTDTAGSGRVPAAFGNVVGLKPTLGSVSNTGLVPACRSIDAMSVFARSVDESLAVLRVMAGYDPVDSYARRAPFDHLRRGAGSGATRVGVAAVEGICEPDVTARYVAACSGLSVLGVDVQPFLDIARLLYDGPWVAERTSVLRDIVLARPEMLHPVTLRILQEGFQRRSVDAFDAFHKLAAGRRMIEGLFERIDALLLPTAPFCPTLAELEADPLGPNTRLGTFTNFANLCDLAGFAVPAGFGADGLPVGVMVLGPAWSEGRLAAIADRIHRAATSTVGATRQALPPAGLPDAVHPDETRLFCVGAHMAGLKLNPQVTSLGGRLLGDASTAPCYRLYALGERPGLVRDPTGAAIAGEVWALPTQAIGALLNQVPPPLGFGTATLSDGPCLSFLAEADSVAGARDVTEFGGWRGWLDNRET